MILIALCGQFFLADSLYSQRIFDLAAVEYERAFFFYPEARGDLNKRVYCAIAVTNSGRIRGLEELEGISREFPELDGPARISIARCYLKHGYYYTAAQMLSPAAEHRLLGYIMVRDGRFVEARELFASAGETAIANDIGRYIADPGKSVMKATLMSLVLPGLGQAYAGNPKRGIVDFALTAGSAFLLYDAFRDKRYVDASLAFSFLFNRFYVGSIANAQRLALEWNEKEKNKRIAELEHRYFEDMER